MFGVFGVFVNTCSRTHCVREHTVFENTCSRTHTVNTPVNTCSVCSVCSRTRVRVCSRIFVFGVFENTCSSVFVTKVRVFESVFRAVFDLCSRTRVRVCSSASVFENNFFIYSGSRLQGTRTPRLPPPGTGGLGAHLGSPWRLLRVLSGSPFGAFSFNTLLGCFSGLDCGPVRPR